MNRLDLWRVNFLLIIYAFMFVCEFIINQLTHSVLVLVDAYHNLFIFTTLILLLINHKTSNTQSIRNTFGWVRISILGRLITQCFFAALAFALLVESLQLMIHIMHEPSNVRPKWNLIASLGSLVCHSFSYHLINRLLNHESSTMSIHGTHVQMHFVVRPQDSPESIVVQESSSPDANVVADSDETRRSSFTQSFGKNKDKSIEMKQRNGNKYASVWNDNGDQKTMNRQRLDKSCSNKWFRSACSAFFLLLASIIQLALIERDWLLLQVTWLQHIPFYSWYSNVSQFLDPLFGMISILIIGVLIYPDMKQSGLILLQTMPASLDLAQLRRQLFKQCPSVLGIHELHIWCLTSSTTIATCHLLLMNEFYNRAEYEMFVQQVNQVFRRQGIERVTVQPEYLRDKCANIGDESLHLTSALPIDSQQHLLRMRVEQNDFSDRCLFTCPANTKDCAEKVCCHRKDEDGHCSQAQL